MKRSLGLVLLLLSGGLAPALGQDPRDAVILDPTHHHVILENDHVQIFEVLADLTRPVPCTAIRQRPSSASAHRA